jgi:hypothetical protein
VTVTSAIDLRLEGAPGVLRLTPYRPSEEKIREGQRYAYRFRDLEQSVVDVEPGELFHPYADDTNAGDFLPRQCVGSLAVVVTFADGGHAATSLEVLPTKLKYETEYRAMLEQIADHAAEAVLQGYAPAALQAFPDSRTEASLAYRSLAFLASRFRDETFQGALQRVRRHPNRDWEHVPESHPLGAGVRSSSLIARALLRGGSSLPSPDHLAHLPLRSVPRSVETVRDENTYDTIPNRFVRYAFTRWQAIAHEVLAALRARPEVGAGPRRRGEAEAQWISDMCEGLLAEPAFREAGPLRAFPSGNQVLLRQPGYRDLLRVFTLAETTMALDADLPDDAFSATQRNVATLYEYWCFIALAKCLSAVAGDQPTGLLFESSASGLSLVLKQGESSKLSWALLVEGRALLADLWFNRSFNRTVDASSEIGSWSRRLRPDASLRIRPKSARPRESVDPELDVWIHFDAKYRIEELAVDEPIEDGDEKTDVDSSAKREDLLRMHAYRDAIRRSAGAYVLYPGDGHPSLQREFHEFLPGLGAFPLRPQPGGGIAGAEEVERFIREVARHVANQASSMERTQYWTARYNSRSGQRVRPVEFLDRPPADTRTLVGYARTEQVPWVRRTKQYNIRVGDRRGAVDLSDEMLSADLVVLWTGPRSGAVSVVGAFERVGPWLVADAEELASSGYPVREASERYLVTAIEPLPVIAEDLIRAELIALLPRVEFGAPATTTWEKISK